MSISLAEKGIYTTLRDAGKGDGNWSRNQRTRIRSLAAENNRVTVWETKWITGTGRTGRITLKRMSLPLQGGCRAPVRYYFAGVTVEPEENR